MPGTRAKGRQSVGPHLICASPLVGVAVSGNPPPPHFLTCSIKQCESWDDGAGVRVLAASEGCPKQRPIFPQALLSCIPEMVMAFWWIPENKGRMGAVYKSGPSFSISPLELARLAFIRFSFSDSQKMSSGVSC